MRSQNYIYAPVALFAFDRPHHLRRVVESLKQNRESLHTDLIIFIDGPKSLKNLKNNKQIEEYSKSINGFKSVEVNNSPVNLGLAKSITQGITQVLSINDRLIVLEDDLIVSTHFLQFMNNGLDIYENEPDVASIHGYIYPTVNKLPTTFFLRGADCWGWATWRRAWNKYDDDGPKLLKRVEASRDLTLFDFEGHGGYKKMLQNSIDEKIDSWAVKWYASIFLEGMYTLYPGRTLVKNIGTDGTGTHGGINKKVSNQKLGHGVTIEKIAIEDNEQARKAFVKYFKSQNHYLRHQILIKIRNIFNRYSHD